MIGRIGVYGSSQVLSTVLVFFFVVKIQCSADLLRHVYSLFAVIQQLSLSQVHVVALGFHPDSNPPHCRKYSPAWATWEFLER